MAEKLCEMVGNSGGGQSITKYSNEPDINTGVSELTLTLPKGVYFVHTHQNIHDNNQVTVLLNLYKNNVAIQNCVCSYALASGSWKAIVLTAIVEIDNDNTELKAGFGRTVYEACLNAYKIG